MKVVSGKHDHYPDWPWWYWCFLLMGWMTLMRDLTLWAAKTFGAVETLGYFATVLNIVGNLMLTSINVWGWVVRLLVNVLYIGYAIQVDKGMPMVVNHVAFIAINITGWIRWRKKGH